MMKVMLEVNIPVDDLKNAKISAEEIMLGGIDNLADKKDKDIISFRILDIKEIVTT